MNCFEDMRILVTGSCGTIGTELIRQLLCEYSAAEVIGVDNNESEIFFQQQHYSEYKNSRFLLADIRDRNKLARLFQGIDIVFHAAAYKHVILCEYSPYETVQTNIIGVHNVVDAAIENKVKRVIFTSSDKAVNPTNVMGTSKLMGERLITAANSNMHSGDTLFSSTRFGNVMGSRGSVVPIFSKQIKKGGPVTLTDNRMTRFIMSIREAASLVIDSANLACGGEVFVTKMPVIRIKDLAVVMIEEFSKQYGYNPGDIEIKTIGSKPGEKLYEELMSEEETARTIELEKYFIILPAFRSLYRSINYDFKGVVSSNCFTPYNSSNQPIMSKNELVCFLNDNKLIDFC
ncbi:polysaccharide biosynthesis protein [Desulfotignum phosphitoxidans]|uniref:Capsular polysaccharide biosynthesis protein CapD n=1 Tax=Desulfotignum phosphitoxidans DSM 13687 TaxID=1286635 RepID=S0FWZ1_9BACT|nr:polysaccharide biosynthesis protein [Desulfotignum phosphitoxidans]EMS77659.1 capsular polysaccharide biosynthesis protein CapD [Desulfotignum phosphitoxidans DSM 13687]